ncbi:MAG: hypothetical protein AB7E79_04680 [Rhodospirillaceae bacterium]
MNFRRCRFAARWHALTAGGVALALSSALQAKGPPEDRGKNSASGLSRELSPDTANSNPGSHHDTDNGEGGAIGRTAVLSGLSVDDDESFLRLRNLGNTDGTVAVTLFDAKSGEQVGRGKAP